MTKETKEFKFSKSPAARRVGSPAKDDAEAFTMPIDPKYFTKLPENMEPPTWMRLKTILAYQLPPTPVLEAYPMSFNDDFWELKTVPVKQRGGGTKTMYMLIYNYRTKHEEQGIAASMLFQQIAVKGSKSGRGYDILNIKFAMYDCEISHNVNIRLISNPF